MYNDFLELGAHLRVYRGGYWHHAIYVGWGYVVHYTNVRPNKRDATIEIGTVAEFAEGGEFEVVRYDHEDPIEVVLERARRRVGETAYHLTRNNCEHFARWCKTGESISDQVRRASATATGAAGSAAAAVGAVSTVAAVGTVAGTSGAGLMSGLGTVGGAAGLGAAGGIGVVAAAPAVVTTFAVNHAFRDDPALDIDERQARRAARVTGRVSAAAGAVSAVGLVSAVGVPGLSAVGITTGLAGIGGAVGGGMLTGLFVAAGLPVVAGAGLAALAYRAARKRRRN